MATRNLQGQADPSCGAAAEGEGGRLHSASSGCVEGRNGQARAGHLFAGVYGVDRMLFSVHLNEALRKYLMT